MQVGESNDEKSRSSWSRVWDTATTVL